MHPQAGLPAARHNQAGRHHYAFNIYRHIYSFLKGIKGTTAPPSTGSSTATSIISGFIDEHLSFSLVRTYHPFSSVCLHLEQLLCNIADKGNQASREHTQHNSQDSQQKDGNQHYGIRFLPYKAFS